MLANKKVQQIAFWTLVAILAVYSSIPVTGQEPCGVYVQVSEVWDNNSATLDNAAIAECSNGETWAESHIVLPSGRRADASASGGDYAEAVATISINGETGQGSFTWYSSAADRCWAGTTSSDTRSNSFRLNDPTPNITSISPIPWQAGVTNYPVTIIGSNFGAMPILSISDPSGGTTFTYGNRSNTQIIANITISPNTPPESITITVTSAGYDGFGFVSTSGSAAQSPTKSVDILNPLFGAYGFDITVLGPVTGLSSQTNSVVSGQGFTLRVTAKSSTGSVAFYYSGTIHFSSGDPYASLPHDYSFSGLDQGTHDFSNVILKTVSGNSPTRDVSVTDVSSNASATQNIYLWFNVVASREGLVGSQTATGHIITTNDHFVALPTSTAFNTAITVLYGGNTAHVSVLDSGPWCPHSVATSGNPCVCNDDNYWRSSGVPFVVAASCDSDNAGIDLADGTFYDLGLSGNGPVYWRFQ